MKAHQLVGYLSIENDAPLTVKGLLQEIELLKQGTKDENVLVSLEVIEEELSVEDYRKPVIQGMMSNLKTEPLAEVLLARLNQFLGNVSE